MTTTINDGSLIKEELKIMRRTIPGKLLIDLQKRGFFYSFKIADKCIWCDDYSIRFDEFDILEVHSMETSSSEKNCILYAIRCDKFNIKGIVIDQPGIYANAFSGICISKILNTEKLKLQYYQTS